MFLWMVEDNRVSHFNKFTVLDSLFSLEKSEEPGFKEFPKIGSKPIIVISDLGKRNSQLSEYVH